MKLMLVTNLLALALSVAPSSEAAGLGRLFFTPEQRAQLESGQQPDVETPDAPRVISVSGIVQKHGGERTVWINGVAQLAGSGDESAPESVPIAIPGQSQPARIKVGQKMLLIPPVKPETAARDAGQSED